MAKKLFLHLGTNKTGTTALQFFLSLNYHKLQQDGFMYPLAGRIHPDSEKAIEVHHPLAFSLYEKMNYGMFKKNYPIRYYAQQVKKEFDNSTSDSIILSSEQFWLLSHPQIENLLKEFSFFDEVYFILYIRRQDKFLESLMIQNIKDDKPSPDPCMNYLDIIHKFTSFVERKQFFVRIYEETQLSGGNIFSDFLNVIGLPLRDDYNILRRNPNPSLLRNELEFKRLTNKLPLSSDQKTEIRHVLMRLSIVNGSGILFREHELLSPLERREIVFRYNASNSQIAKDFLGRQNGVLFHTSLPDSNETWEPYPGLSRTKVIEISNYIKKENLGLFEIFTKAAVEGLESDDLDIRAAAQTLLPSLGTDCNLWIAEKK